MRDLVYGRVMDAEQFRVLDPARYRAIRESKFLVKTYHTDMGCIDYELFDTSTEALEYIEVSAKQRGDDQDYDYRYYAPDGEPILFDILWKPHVRCRN